MIMKRSRGETEPATDIGNCRALDLGLVIYGECVCSGPNECPYAMPFGYAFLCEHPRVSEIMEQSKQLALGTSQE